MARRGWARGRCPARPSAAASGARSRRPARRCIGRAGCRAPRRSRCMAPLRWSSGVLPLVPAPGNTKPLMPAEGVRGRRAESRDSGSARPGKEQVVRAHGDEGTAHRIVTALALPFVQLVVGALVIVTGAALGVSGWLGWRGALPRNRFVGVRTPVSMASDEAFRAGNRAAGPVLVAAGLVAVLGGLSALAAPSAAAFAVVLGVVTAGALG